MPANLEGLAIPPPEAEVPPDQRRALVVAAHPDDAEFGAAGTAYLWSQAGWAFHYLVCTNGAKGTDDPALTPGELGQIRQSEQRAAAGLLGVKEVSFLDNEDGELTPDRRLLGDIVRCIRRVQPYAVFTHDHEAVIVNNSFVNHADHRATGLNVIDAVYPAARDRLNFPEHIEQGLEPHKVSEIYIWGSERADFHVDITDVIDTKIAALASHASQFEPAFFDSLRDLWKTPEGRYIESFRRVRMAV